ncbi:MAG: hypothetical protein SV910_06195 [Chloroflexota bacterium]|nr:hypothetical protein [Chloroflexota bacterium]
MSECDDLFCTSCVYYSEGRCALHSELEPSRSGAWCDDYVPHGLSISPSSAGCCGLNNLPYLGPAEKSEAER